MPVTSAKRSLVPENGSIPSQEESATATRPSKVSDPAARKAHVIAIVNQKGGVGKTTTAINVAASLALEGISTLLIDCDPQANATSGLGVQRDSSRASVYDLLMSGTTVKETVVETEIPKLSLVPGSKNLIGSNLELVSQPRREFRLRDALAPALSSYRFIILDCPPALDLLTLNALVAADGLLVPMQAEYFALEGISELMNTLDRVVHTFNPALSLEGVLLTMYDDRTNLSQQVSANLRDFFTDKLFASTIPRNVRLAEAPSHGKPAALYDARSRGAEAYRELAFEILKRHGISAARNPAPSSDEEQLTSKVETRKIRFWPYNK